MNQSDFQKTKYYLLCRKCGTKNPLTATNCQNYSCGANLLVYGRSVDPNAPDLEVTPKAPDLEDLEQEMKRQKELKEKKRREQDELWQKAQEEQRRKEQEERERREQIAREQEIQRQKELEEKQRREQEAQRQKELEEKQRREQDEQRQKALKKERRRLRLAEFAYIFAMIWAFLFGLAGFGSSLPIVGILCVLIGFILIIPLKKTQKRRKEIDVELSGGQDRDRE